MRLRSRVFKSLVPYSCFHRVICSLERAWLVGLDSSTNVVASLGVMWRKPCEPLIMRGGADMTCFSLALWFREDVLTWLWSRDLYFVRMYCCQTGMARSLFHDVLTWDWSCETFSLWECANVALVSWAEHFLVYFSGLYRLVNWAILGRSYLFILVIIIFCKFMLSSNFYLVLSHVFLDTRFLWQCPTKSIPNQLVQSLCPSELPEMETSWGEKFSVITLWGLSLSGLQLFAWNHPIEWVMITFIDIADFTRNDKPTYEFRPGICQYLQDAYDLGQESVVGDSVINTTFARHGCWCPHGQVPWKHIGLWLDYHHQIHALYVLGLRLPSLFRENFEESE